MNEYSSQKVLRVLVVDDSEASAKTMGWALELLGHNVYVALDGAEALATALDHKPHVVLLDLNLPGLDGYELCRIMRSEHGFDKSIFIAQTGWGDAEHRRLSQEAGFSHHLVKPIDIGQVQQLITSYAAGMVETLAG